MTLPARIFSAVFLVALAMPAGGLVRASDDLPAVCDTERWVGAWSAPPSDASRGSDVTDGLDASINVKTVTRNETVRAILTPTLGGERLRVHLSNRFGTVPVTFDRVTVARSADGPAIVATTLREVAFAGSRAVTAAAGADVTSDAIDLPFDAGDRLAVSVFVAGDVGKATNHFMARQTSYLTPEDGGDHTTDVEGVAFSERTTSRPFVTGLDVMAPSSVGAVVAFGDSISDGYQGQPPDGAPESLEGLDADARYTDALAGRLRAAEMPLSVLNAGIGGNRLLVGGGARDASGPAGLDRLRVDAIDQAGVTTVILFEGINDLGTRPSAAPADIIAGYRRAIDELHGAGLRVLHGTLTPAGGATDYGTPELETARQVVNAWIRAESPADVVVDFDAAVRDPADSTRLAPEYDGGDHLHLNPAGNRALAAAVPLDELWLPECEEEVVEGADDNAREAARPVRDRNVGPASTSPAPWLVLGVLAALGISVGVVLRGRRRLVGHS